MVQISRRKLSDVMLEKLFSLFFEMVGKRDNRSNFQDVIDDILSSVEKIMIAKRIAIMYLVSKGVDHRSIANYLKVSTATVAKFAIIAERSQGVVPACEKMLQQDKLKNLLTDMFDDYSRPSLDRVITGRIPSIETNQQRRKRLGRLA